MASEARLPSRFPVGTHYILEGETARGGKLRVISRSLVLPSGVRYDLTKPASGDSKKSSRKLQDRKLSRSAC